MGAAHSGGSVVESDSLLLEWAHASFTNADALDTHGADLLFHRSCLLSPTVGRCARCSRRIQGLRPEKRFGAEVEFFLAGFFECRQACLEIFLLRRSQLGKDVHRAFLFHGLTEDLFALGGQCDAD